MKRAVFLDRDGVLSVPTFRDGRSYAPLALDDFVLYEDAAAGVARLKEAGFVVIVVTNQPDVGAGKTPQNVVEAMHERLRQWTGIDDVEVSYETSAQGGRRRKPEPGMLLDAAAKWHVDLSRSYMVGDRASDVDAGLKAGCVPVFVDRGYSAEAVPAGQIATVLSLSDAVDVICAHALKEAHA